MCRRLREWAWDYIKTRMAACSETAPAAKDRPAATLNKVSWIKWQLASIIHGLAWAIAYRRDRSRSICWLSCALWAMGSEGYGINDRIRPGCNDCGKCGSPREAEARP